MMKTITICTFNVQNNYRIKNYDGQEKPLVLANFIKNNSIDIVGLQEVTPKYLSTLKNHMASMDNLVYFFYGDFRLGKEDKRFNKFISNRFNEANIIVAKNENLRNKTCFLTKKPLFHFTLLPRIATICYHPLEGLDTPVIIINTHIDFLVNITKKIQLKNLLKIIKSLEDYPIVIMGDFNLAPNSALFKYFISELEKLNIKRVINPNYTHKYIKLELDHIFIPSSWDILEVTTYDDLDNISDHNPVLIKVKI